MTNKIFFTICTKRKPFKNSYIQNENKTIITKLFGCFLLILRTLFLVKYKKPNVFGRNQFFPH